MSNLVDQLQAIVQQAALSPAELKAALREFVRQAWPDLPAWSTLAGPVIEEAQKATVGCGVVLAFREDGVWKVVVARAGDHYQRPAAAGPAYLIPGGFIDLSSTPGSALVPPSSAPEDGRVGAAREVEEELRKPDGSPLLQVSPLRLKPMDTKTLALRNGERRIVIGFLLELNASEIATVKEHVARLATDPAYQAATTEQSRNHTSGRAEVCNVCIFELEEVAAGRCQLLHPDQQSLFVAVAEHFGATGDRS